MVCADDVNILDERIYTVKKNAEALVVASKETDQEVNAEKTMCMGIWYQNAGQIHSIKIYDKSFERVGSDIWDQT